MDREGIPTRKVIDVVKNNQGEAIVGIVRSVDMVVVNGRIKIDRFTCVSERRSSVVDYCIIRGQNIGLIGNFKVTTMNESIEEVELEGIAVRVLDHSLLQWDILRKGISEEVKEEKPPEARKNLWYQRITSIMKKKASGSWRTN